MSQDLKDMVFTGVIDNIKLGEVLCHTVSEGLDWEAAGQLSPRAIVIVVSTSLIRRPRRDLAAVPKLLVLTHRAKDCYPDTPMGREGREVL